MYLGSPIQLSNNIRITAWEWSAENKSTGGLNTVYCADIFTVGSDVVLNNN